MTLKSLRNLVLLPCLLITIGCEKKSDQISFRFINSTPFHIDTLYLNHTGAGRELVWPITLANLPVGDTTDYVRFQEVSEPLIAKVVCWPKSSICGIYQGNYVPSDPSYFEIGKYIVHFTLADTADLTIFYSCYRE